MTIGIEKYGDYGYTALRIVFGLLIAGHGAMKFGLIGAGDITKFAGAFSFPLWLGVLVALVELAGGLLIALGLFTRIAAFGTGVVMIGAIIIAHLPKGINIFTNGGELPILFLMAFILIAINGAKMLSLEKLLIRKEII